MTLARDIQAIRASDAINTLHRDCAGRMAVIDRLAEALQCMPDTGIGQQQHERFWRGIEQVAEETIRDLEIIKGHAITLDALAREPRETGR